MGNPGDEYIYLGETMSMKEVDRELYKMLSFGDKLSIFYYNKIKPIFSKRKCLDNSVE